MNIGLMGNALRPLIQQDMVYGYDIAANELVDSIMKYSSASDMTCFYEPEQFQKEILERKYRKVTRKDKNINKNLSFESEYDLIFSPEYGLDVDVLHNVSSEFTSLAALRETSRKSFPITFTIHCASYPELLYQFFLPMFLMPLKSYDTLICTSESVRQSVEKILSMIQDQTGHTTRINLAKIPLGVDTEIFRPQERDALREKYGFDREEFIILWLGRFSAGDKADLLPLLHVFRNLKQHNEGKKCRLLLAGYQPQNTNYFGFLQEKVKAYGLEGEVTFFERHNVKNRYELYGLSDVFTSPIDNIQETFGITPLEAMACGIPQVVSDWDGYRDTVRHGETGFLVPSLWCPCDNDICNRGMLPNDAEHRSRMHHYLLSQTVALDLNYYESALQKLWDSKRLRTKMGERSRKRVLERFDWKHVIKQYDSLWNELSVQCSRSEEELMPQKLILPHYFRCFSHYASCVWEDDRPFRAAGPFDGIHAPYGIEPLFLEEELMKLILQACMRKESSVQEIIGMYGGYSLDQIRRAVMYLLKHGYLTGAWIKE